MRKGIGSEVVAPGIVTLGDMLSSAPSLIGDVEIVNECNETLLIVSYVEDNIVPLSQVLSNTLLDRKLLNYGVRDGRALFKIEGIEDAM